MTISQGHGLSYYKFYVYVIFKISYFLNPLIDLNYSRYDERFAISFSISSTPGHDLQVKVTDFDILY